MPEYKSTEITFDDVEIRDLRGVRVKLDNTVIVGFRQGSSSETRIGIVRGVRRRDGAQSYNRDTLDFFLKIEWVLGSSYLPDSKTTWISAHHIIGRYSKNQFVVVDLPTIED